MQTNKTSPGTGRVAVSLIGALILMAPHGAVRAADIAVTIYADEGYPPYAYVEHGRPAGIYYNIVKTAAARLPGYKITIQPVPWKRGMDLLQRGDGFALYPPYKNTKDEPWTWPYSLPLYGEHVVAMCRKDVVTGKGTMRWPQDFFGLTVGNNAGFIVGGAAFEQAVADGNIKREEGRDNRTNILKLELRRIDCYINDRVSIAWTRRQMMREGLYQQGTRHVELVEAAVIGTQSGHLGYTNRDKGTFAYKTDFATRFDRVIEQMKRRGEIDRIATDFFRAHGMP
jgi:polar amino acid transport system substrate-binding protein